MFFKGQRDTIPSSRFRDMDVIEGMHWTLEQYQVQPSDFIVELRTRMRKRALAQRKE